ncbi:O-methyltransferase-domain-containing protein [Stachybotrys elegans]|uniref:O-methyltransferase-domain-containing protein n=1 Tax=Stachybotrys elegans TaxID=80388 RepID=A0A8K0S855_9HYPO|nr:O-methyltransferase-domain-containing protein [Stachybotrys elegans]
MESVLQELVDSLKSAASRLETSTALQALQDSLPNAKLSSLASEALDLLSSIRLSLEPAHLILADHYFGCMNTKALVTAVEMGVPDALRSPATLPELASKCNARPDRFRQVMRTLHNNGIFAYDVDTDTYSNNATSTLLLKDHWTQWRNWVELYGNEFYDMARGIPESCKAGATRSPAQINYDTDESMFQYFTTRGWIQKFHKTLGGGAIAQAPGILRDYPWHEIADSTILDIGGGSGGLIALLLREHKQMRGAILEVPHVIDQAKANFYEGEYADVAAQVENLIIGDFFRQVPQYEVYTMKWCLHNWDDEKVKVVLSNIRQAIKKSPISRFIILESVMTEGHMGRMARFGDLNMMLAVGGQERSKVSWRQLAKSTGWELKKIYPLTNAWPCAIELMPIWSDSVTAQVKFLEPWNASKGNPFVRINPAPGFDRMNFKWEDYSIEVQEARPDKTCFTLDKHGFAYYDDEIPQSTVDALRGDKETVKSLYYPHVEEFVKNITGSSRVIIFDHTLRKRRPDLSKMENNDGKEQPATMVHCDQSELGAIRRLKMNIDESENVDELLKERVEMINVWRPLNGPVQDWPLATMDYQTVRPDEMYPCDLLRGENEFRGQTATFTHSANQKWYYLDKQRTNEVTVIKIWDSNSDETARC